MFCNLALVIPASSKQIPLGGWGLLPFSGVYTAHLPHFIESSSLSLFYTEAQAAEIQLTLVSTWTCPREGALGGSQRVLSERAGLWAGAEAPPGSLKSPQRSGPHPPTLAVAWGPTRCGWARGRPRPAGGAPPLQSPRRVLPPGSLCPARGGRSADRVRGTLAARPAPLPPACLSLELPPLRPVPFGDPSTRPGFELAPRARLHLLPVLWATRGHQGQGQRGAGRARAGGGPAAESPAFLGSTASAPTVGREKGLVLFLQVSGRSGSCPCPE